MTQPAIVFADGLFQGKLAKTAHGLVRGSERFRVVGVVDHMLAGRDAGEVLDGKARGIPIFASLGEALAQAPVKPEVCIVGVATHGGVLPDDLRQGLLEAADAGLDLVNGLHQLLGDDAEFCERVAAGGGRIIDIRRPPPVKDLRFWSGAVLSMSTPRIAILGTDCAMGKRTTCCFLLDACRENGIDARMIYTGQTGWLQGISHGFIFDATPNDFVCGELERALLACEEELSPELILIEGQSSLRNPAGPCGAEFIISGGARGVILQHAPARHCFDDLEDMDCVIPPLSEEIALIRLLGGEVLAITLNEQGLDEASAAQTQLDMQSELDLPVLRPLHDGMSPCVPIVRAFLD